MKHLALLAALMLAPFAAAQTPAAPELPLQRDALGDWSWDQFWVSPDLLLLGRPLAASSNRELSFWSRARGVFKVTLPATIPENEGPDTISFCANDGALQWLSPTAYVPRNDVTPVNRKVYRLHIDPQTGEARADDSQRLPVIKAIRAGNLYMHLRKTRGMDLPKGVYYLRGNGCQLVDPNVVNQAVNAIPELATATHIEMWGIYSEGIFRVEWTGPGAQPSKGMIYDESYVRMTRGPSGEILFTREADDVEVQPQKLMSAAGEVRVVELSDKTGPIINQVQLVRPDGRVHGITTSPDDRNYSISLSPDGCLLHYRMFGVTRLPPAPSVRPPPPPANQPPPPNTLGAVSTVYPTTMVDLCSPANSKQLDAR